MDKKTLTIILICAAVLLVMYLLYGRKDSKKNNGGTAGGTNGSSGGSGTAGGTNGSSGGSGSAEPGFISSQSALVDQKQWILDNVADANSANILNKTQWYIVQRQKSADAAYHCALADVAEVIGVNISNIMAECIPLHALKSLAIEYYNGSSLVFN